MKQFKSNKNQPRWTKTMSMLSLTVAVQTQACAGTKVEMKNPVNLFALSRVDQDAQRAYKKHQTDLKNIGIDLPMLEINAITALRLTTKDQKGNTFFSLIVKKSIEAMTVERAFMALRCLDDEQIRPVMLHKNPEGCSVLTVAALSKQPNRFKEVLTHARKYLKKEDFVQVTNEFRSLLREKKIKDECFLDCTALLSLAEQQSQSRCETSALLPLPPSPPPFPTTMLSGVSAGKPQVVPTLGDLLNKELQASFKKRRANKSNDTSMSQKTTLSSEGEAGQQTVQTTKQSANASNGTSTSQPEGAAGHTPQEPVYDVPRPPLPVKTKEGVLQRQIRERMQRKDRQW